MAKMSPITQVEQTATTLFNEFTEETRSTVAAMTSTLNRKTRTAQARAVSSRKAGILDASKLAFYSTRDDIFSSKQVLPTGKSHKVVILIDWSGSMQNILRSVVMQAITIARFCKRSNVKFSVMAFTSLNLDSNMADVVEDYDRSLVDCINDYTLLEFMNDRMSIVELEKSAKNLFFMTNGKFRETGERAKRGQYSRRSPFGLGGTPLNISLVGIRDMISTERSRYESYNLVVLSDGDSCKIYSGEVRHRTSDSYPIFMDIKTGKSHEISADIDAHHAGNYARCQTDLILGLIKDQGVKTFFYHFDDVWNMSRMSQLYPGMIGIMRSDESDGRPADAYEGVWFMNATKSWFINPNALFNNAGFEVHGRPSRKVWIDEDDEDDEVEDFSEEDRQFAAMSSDNQVESLVKQRQQEVLKQLIGTNLVNEICKEIRYL